MKRTIRACLVGAIPDPILGVLEYVARPGLHQSAGDGMNGQPGRREIVERLFAHLPFQAIVETGTYRGTTTAYFAERWQLPITTIEVNRRYATYARLRLRNFKHVTVREGNSAQVLRELADRGALPTEGVFFYLDAHCWGYLPLEEEIETILTGFSRWVALIDDFQVWGDPGYRFITCAGKTLNLDLLRPLDRFGVVAFPGIPSSEEGGAICGSVLVTSPDIERTAVADAGGLAIYDARPIGGA